MPSTGELRGRFVRAGLGRFADQLVAVSAASIGLQRGEAKVAEAAYRVSPVELRGVGGAAFAIASSEFHWLALLADGPVLGWGGNAQGQLGDGTKASRRRPVAVPDPGGVQAVAAAESHSLALTGGGSVFAWGNNDAGQLGDGTRVSRLTPVAVDGLDRGVRGVFAGWSTSYAILADGSVVGWGINAVELLGIYDSPTRPVPVPGLEADVVAVAVGNTHRLALRSDGAVLGWGWPLGRGGHEVSNWELPRRLDLNTMVRAIAAGRDHALVLTCDGQVLAWGDNALRRLGVDDDEDTSHPAPIIGLESVGVSAIAAGWGHSLVLTDDGAVLAWGWNHEGALGDGTLTDRSMPVETACPREIQAIAPRAALTHDGRILEWGGRLPKRKRDGEAGLPLGASKLGGRPDLPQDTAWPRVEGRPMSFVAQVKLDDLAHLDEDRVLPATGLLSFFCALNSLGGERAGRVLYTEPGAPLVRAKAPAELEADERFAPAPLAFASELSAVPWQSEQLDRLGLSGEQRQAYRDALEQDEETPIHRMLGHPDAVQDDPRAGQDNACLLLQVDSDEGVGMMWGDVGRLYYLIERSDLVVRRFDRCRLDFQCY